MVSVPRDPYLQETELLTANQIQSTHSIYIRLVVTRTPKQFIAFRFSYENYMYLQSADS
jgi:hypothetical protein